MRTEIEEESDKYVKIIIDLFRNGPNYRPTVAERREHIEKKYNELMGRVKKREPQDR